MSRCWVIHICRSVFGGRYPQNRQRKTKLWLGSSFCSKVTGCGHILWECTSKHKFLSEFLLSFESYFMVFPRFSEQLASEKYLDDCLYMYAQRQVRETTTYRSCVTSCYENFVTVRSVEHWIWSRKFLVF